MKKSELTLIENICEQMVLSEIRRHVIDLDNREYIADIACVALNKLKPVYTRKSTKIATYRDRNDLLELKNSIRDAVDQAFCYVGCESDTHREADLHLAGQKNRIDENSMNNG